MTSDNIMLAMKHFLSVEMVTKWRN